MDLKLKDKVVLVTGGTGGIGSAIVKAFLGEGAKVAFSSTSQKKIDDLLPTLGAAEGQVCGFVADMTKEEDIKKKFPLSYKDIWTKCMARYSDFKKNQKFNEIMKRLQANEKLTHTRKLDADNPKTVKQMFYSTNIWKELDKEYTKTH